MSRGGRGRVWAGRVNAVFDSAQLVIEGRPRRAMRLYCYRCGKPGNCLMNTMHHGSGSDEREQRIAARKFSELGWEVDLRKGKHFCPECQLSPQVKQQKKDDEAMANVVSIPRQMGRDDRRVIFEKLNEVYLDEKRGYETPWTDETVAKDLGTPRAWVQQVREEMFGPVGSNPDIDVFLKGFESLRASAAAAEEFVTKFRALEPKVEAIQKAVRP